MRPNVITPNKEYLKEKAMLEKICEECGRKGHISAVFCNDCWMTMRQELCKKKQHIIETIRFLVVSINVLLKT